MTLSQKNPRQLNSVSPAKVRILFLGYQREETRIIDAMMARNCEIWHTDDVIDSTAGYDLVISFGYSHIVKASVIDSSPAPIINLHISYLPYNRGAHPNFWSFFDGTPSGVSIHLIDEGIDTGPILFQKYANFPESLKTFRETYSYLFRLIEELFIENIETIVSRTYRPMKQRHKGTYHRVSDLPKDFSGWDSNIEDEIGRLGRLYAKEK